MDILYIVCCHYVVDDSVPSWAIVDVLRVNYDLTKRYFIIRSLFVCLLVHMFILIDIFYAVNDLHSYFVITAFDSDNKSILIQ